MIPKAPFGRTGHMSTRVIFGAAALGRVTQEEADRTLDVLLQYGINHIDTAASYGEAEDRIGPWMPRYRKEFFLATKTGERTYEKAKEQIHRSLERMRVDSVDLIQLHALIDPGEWKVAMGPGGALEAAIEAREQGLTRFIGVTGHEISIAAMHQLSLNRFDFDSILLPYNYLIMKNPVYAAGFEAVEKICKQRKVAIQTIKSLARAPWGDKPRARACWYEPWEEQADIDLAVGYVLSRPGIFLNSTGDIFVLPKLLDAANRFEAGPAEATMEKLVAEREAIPLFR
ncbi:MAG: aldo/keto reductase [Anaerolineae bacterium]|jgi:aryl-alcohol dehydrogenase-like predicted oxidoreductase|nr:aldo/keto reductase [Anaerolineae bacterium]